MQFSFAVHPSRGLWVGEVTLDAVNEATGAVGDSNTYEFSDPAIPTPTSDAAYLRLILHVNGAGQVQLLKSVAIASTGTLSNGNADLVLITDPLLYSSYGGIAKRVASAFYDFGDAQAVAAVQTLVDTATNTAVAQALLGTSEATIRSNIQTQIDDLIEAANVEAAYLDRGTNANSFITTGFFTLSEVDVIADAVVSALDGIYTVESFEYDGSNTYSPFPGDPLPGSQFAAVVANAFALKTASFYGDTRGIDAIVNLVLNAAIAADALPSGSTEPERQAVARLATQAAWYNAADVDQGYNRFLASAAYSTLPNAILSEAVLAAVEAQALGQSEAEIQASVGDALLLLPAVQSAYVGAQTVLSQSLNDDPRARLAVDSILLAAQQSAAAQVSVSTEISLLTNIVAQALEDRFNAVEPGAIFATAPSDAYNDFVLDSDFIAAASTAASTAASEAAYQYAAGVTDSGDLRKLTVNAVSKALVGIRNNAAALPMNQVTLNGELAVGEAINGEFYLPALAPSNPFMHRMHPDHTEGIAITRRIQLIVDSDGPTQASYGVSLLTGTYEEEIFGLHKPLGSSQDIGLKTQGRFTLNRLTLADSLNF